ncbi:MAG: hypothetical protein IPI05_06560 [Flavobacteriales bacterium]|nr:hypothetical protein [Flavobacteriales bacterium]
MHHRRYGSFSPDANALNATHMPSASDSIAGGVHLSLTAYGTGNCGSVVDTLFIGIGPRALRTRVPTWTCAPMAIRSPWPGTSPE